MDDIFLNFFYLINSFINSDFFIIGKDLTNFGNFFFNFLKHFLSVLYIFYLLLYQH